MSKLTLKSVNNLSSTEMEAALTDNFTAIEDAVDDCVSRTGKLPNQMEADLDMNGNTIINAKDPVSDTDVATKSYVDNYTTDITWKGDWAPSTDYDENNVVSYNGSGYICINAHTSSSTDMPDSSGNWSLIVSKGDKGDAGELVLSGSVSVTTDYTVTKATNASGVIEVNTAGGAVVLTVDDSVSDSWFFIYREVAGSNGVTVKKASDSSTVTTTSSGIIVCDGTTVTSPVGVEDGSVTTSKLADASVTTAKIADANVTPAKLDSTGAYTVDSLTATTTLLRGTSIIWGDDNFAARIAALTANASPAGTESVACDDGQRVTLQAIADLGGPSFISGWYALSSLSTGEWIVPHGLSSTPIMAALQIECVNSVYGYAVGDRLTLLTDARRYMNREISANSTDVIVTIDTAYNYVVLLNGRGGVAGGYVDTSSTDWNMRILAWG